MTNYPGLNPITPTAYNSSKALDGVYGAEVQKAFEQAKDYFSSVPDDEDLDSAGLISSVSNGSDVVFVEGDDGSYTSSYILNEEDANDIARTYGGVDGQLSLDEMAQVFLDRVLTYASDGDGLSAVLYDRGRTSQAALLSGYMSYPFETDHEAGLSAKDLDKATDHFNRDPYALTEDQARILVNAYGTNGVLSGEQLQKIFTDGTVSTSNALGKVNLTIDLSKLSFTEVANLLLSKDSDGDGKVTAEEFDHATDEIFEDDSVVTGDQAKFLAGAYGSGGALDRTGIEQMIYHGVLQIHPDGDGLSGSIDIPLVPSRQIGSGLMAFGSDGHLTADELRGATDFINENGSGLNQNQARNLVYAYGAYGRLNSDALQELIDAGAIKFSSLSSAGAAYPIYDPEIYTQGPGIFTIYNPSVFTQWDDSSRRIANILMFKDFTSSDPDGRITVEEFDKATDEIFGDRYLVTGDQAKALAETYGTDGFLTRDNIKAMIDDGVLTVSANEDGTLSAELHGY
ncbi:MAG: hypothetical protein HC850_11805 [Rhodomicrobium sp.]|nr:hypothetical protein [Rhodomicrobium sp.]